MKSFQNVTRVRVAQIAFLLNTGGSHRPMASLATRTPKLFKGQSIFLYTEPWPKNMNEEPCVTQYEDGDGTVPLRSAGEEPPDED